jgi:predicted nucleotidyltransferase
MHSVNNKQKLIEALHLHEGKIKSFGVKNMGLFGSFLNNNITPQSDVDLLVDFSEGKKTFDNLMDLGFFLEDMLGRKVEIITPQALDKYIGPHILANAENVIC